jgi:branched-chain amino acid aminotransferase
MNEQIYLNGNVVPVSEAKISPLDYGMLYGLGIFETMRAYNGKVFLLEKHLTRLYQNARALGILLEPDLKTAVNSLLEANGLSEARIRITVSGGGGKSLPDSPDFPNPTILITANAYQPLAAGIYAKGYKAIISTIRRNSQSPVPQLKTTNYLENLMAKWEAKKKGADEVVFLNEQDQVAEAGSANIFIVSEGILITPPVEAGILPGVTREAVIKLAAKLEIETRMQDIWLDNLLEADESFLTNSMYEVMGLVQVAKYRIGDGKPGRVTGRIIDAYRKAVK